MLLEAVELGMDLGRGDVLQGLASTQPAPLSSLAAADAFWTGAACAITPNAKKGFDIQVGEQRHG